MVEPEFIKFIKNENTYLEREPLEIASSKKELYAFKHDDFWQCMDTKRDKDLLEKKCNHFSKIERISSLAERDSIKYMQVKL